MSINDPTMFPQGPTVAQQFSQGLSSIPQSHGVDLSGYQPVNPFQYSAQGLAKSSSTALPTSLPGSQPHGIGGFFSNIWNNGIKPAYNDLSGGLQGWRTGGFQGMVQGFEHPAIAHQNYQQLQQNLSNGISNPFNKWGAHVLNDTLSSPLTYVPVASVAKVAGITPALKFGADLLKGTVKTADAGKAAATQAATNVASQALKKTGGFASPLTDAQAKALNDWAGISGGYVKPDVPAWEYNYANPMDVLNGVHPTTADKIAPLLQGLNRDQAIPQLLGGGTLKANIDQLRSLGSNAVQAYADMAGAKPLMGATAKGATLDAVKQSFSDVANRLAELSHTAEPITPQENGFVLRGGPLMVIPQALKDATDTAASQVPNGIGPYANYAWQSKLGAPMAQALLKAMPNGSNTVKAVSNLLGSAFKPISGARQSFVDAVSRMHGQTQSGANDITNVVPQIFQGTTPEQRIALTHAMEQNAPGTKLADPVLENLRQQVEPLLDQATQQALAEGHIGGTINPADYGVGRYIPHVSVGKLDENAAPFSDITTRKTGVDAAKSRGLEGTIQAINDANGSPVFESDMAKILGYHLGQLNKASAVKGLIDEAMANGIPAGGAVKAGEYFPGTTQRAIEYSHGGNTTLLPESEATFLQGLNVPKTDAQQLRSALYRGTVNTLNRSMFLSNPFIHAMNNLGTQTALHAPGVFAKMPKYAKEAFTGVKPGSQMDEALREGAMHLTSEIGKSTSAKDIANNIAKKLSSDSGQSFLKTAAKQYNDFTPNVEKMYRAAAFEHALQQGKSPEEAVQFVRGIYGGNAAPGTASPFEQAASSVMPFFNWTKTAIGSTLRNAANRPAPYVAMANGLNDANQQVTGHGMLQNPNPISVALPSHDANGNQEYYTPYAPPFDVAKLGKDIAQNGVAGGVGDFAFSRFNPLVKYAGQMVTHEQNPMAQPQNKYNVNPYPYLPAQYNTRGVLFGDKGLQAPAGVAQLLQDVSNPISDAMQLGTQSTGDALISKLFGGSISAPNPLSKVKETNYDNSQVKSELKSWAKKHAGGK